MKLIMELGQNHRIIQPIQNIQIISDHSKASPSEAKLSKKLKSVLIFSSVMAGTKGLNVQVEIGI